MYSVLNNRLKYETNQLYPVDLSSFGISSVNLNVNEFSVASGLNFQGAAGYSFNDFLSFELKFSSFSNSKKEFETSSKSLNDFIYESNKDRHINFVPTVTKAINILSNK